MLYLDRSVDVHDANVRDDVVIGSLDPWFDCVGIMLVCFHVLSLGVLYFRMSWMAWEHCQAGAIASSSL